MDDKTLEALRGSIEKWEKIVAGTGTDEGDSNCPLCKLFHPAHRKDDRMGCEGCPVAEKTGRSGCGGTPYDDFTDAQDEYLEGEGDKRLVLKYAREELAFLKSLLP